MRRGRNDSARRAGTGSARPPCGDLPWFLMDVCEAERFELLGGPFAGLLELGRARHARADVIGQVSEVRFELRLIFFHLLDYFLVHIRNGIGNGRSGFARFGIGLIGQGTARQHFRELRGVVRPGRENLRALIQIVFPHFVEGIGLAVMCLRVLGAVLNAPETGDADVVEGGMIGAESANHRRLEQFQITEWCENFVYDFAILIVVVKAERENFAGTRIVDHNAGNFVEVVLMRLYVAFGADQPLFFATKQDEANCTLGLQVQLRERAGGFKNCRAAGAIIGRASAEVPGIEVGAKDDDFVRLFGAANFCDGVVDIDRAVPNRIGDIQFDFDGSMLQEAINHAVAFAGDERIGNRADVEFLSADAGHVQ